MHVELLAFLRSSTHLGSMVFTPGLSRVGFVFSLLVTDSTSFGSLLLIHSHACSDLAAFLLDHETMELSVSMRCLSHLDLLPFLFGMGRTDPNLSVLDGVESGSALLARSFTRLGPFLLLFDFGKAESPPSLHDFLQVGLVALTFGLS